MRRTIHDVLCANGVSDKILAFLSQEDKRNIRLVSKVARVGVDSSVTAVWYPIIVEVTQPYQSHQFIKDFINSPWKGIKRLNAVDGHICKLNLPDINLLVSAAGLLNLESWTLTCPPLDIECAKKVVNAGWRLREFKIYEQGPSSEWLDYVVKNGSWQVEKFALTCIRNTNYTSPIVAVVAKSAWPIHSLCLRYSQLKARDINVLKTASWISGVENLDVSVNTFDLESCKALAELTHKDGNLKSFQCSTCHITNEACLVLATGKYDRLKSLDLCNYNRFHDVLFSSLLTVIKKCPVLEELDLRHMPDLGYNTYDAYTTMMKTLATCLPEIKTLKLGSLSLFSEDLYVELFNQSQWLKLETLVLSNDRSATLLGSDGWAAAAQLPNLRCLNLLDYYECEFWGEFSRHRWPLVETLQVDEGWLVDDEDDDDEEFLISFEGLVLLPEKLPRLKLLEIRSVSEYTVEYITQSRWPVLEKLKLSQPCKGPRNIKQALDILDPKKFPALKELELVKFTDSDKADLRERAQKMRGGTLDMKFT